MFSWINKILTSRYIKSVTRYLLIALAASLTQIPLLSDLAQFIRDNAGQLTDILAAIFIAIAGGWSFAKNKKNEKVAPQAK